jgi:UDPglucose 6-dehydrogenase
MSLKLSVIGTGYLGAVHATALASVGYQVIGLDVDQEKIATLHQGIAPFYEPNFAPLLEDELRSNRLHFTTDLSRTSDCDVHFICVGTPQSETSYQADLKYIESAVESLIKFAKKGSLIVGKSTVPVGTAEKLRSKIKSHRPDLELAWNPEFLREGFAVEDTLNPTRIVVGVADEKSEGILKELYRFNIDQGVPWICTDLATAELVKASANSFLATKISFINAMAEICDVTGADVTMLAKAIGLDPRIGEKFLGAGIGFGGGCLPKDIRGFMARAQELGVQGALSFLKDIDEINLRARLRIITLAEQELKGDLKSKKIAILGAAFKPESDDVRDSPALDIARGLRKLGAQVWVNDPESIETARKVAPELNYETDLEKLLTDADIVLHLTEWNQYRKIDPNWAIKLVKNPTVIDGRNRLDRTAWSQAGWKFISIGRPTI